MDVLQNIVLSKHRLGEKTRRTISEFLSGDVHLGLKAGGRFRRQPGRFREWEWSSSGPRGFREVLANGPGISIIAELKRRSPAKGMLTPRFDPVSLATSYIAGGARAISVVTEEEHFLGSIEHLKSIVPLGLPVLRKDFILGLDDLVLTQLAGADAVLLIARLHPEPVLERLISCSRLLGLDPVVEVHTERELEKALNAGADVVGINNRNLEDFTCDLQVSIALARMVPKGIVLISESGIRTREDVLRLQEAGFQGLLVGETLVTSQDPEAKLRQLLGLQDDGAPRAMLTTGPKVGE